MGTFISLVNRPFAWSPPYPSSRATPAAFLGSIGVINWGQRWLLMCYLRYVVIQWHINEMRYEPVSSYAPKKITVNRQLDEKWCCC
ncbi:Uncharacterized protein HZ326_28527 [Fusarium oxysporum f. sp. albedinis]|nr:Uncharacterized protein HZ326_28527 [Fusarium oxysporum f. sp. albedinis]